MHLFIVIIIIIITRREKQAFFFYPPPDNHVILSKLTIINVVMVKICNIYTDDVKIEMQTPMTCACMHLMLFQIQLIIHSGHCFAYIWHDKILIIRLYLCIIFRDSRCMRVKLDYTRMCRLSHVSTIFLML